MQQPVKQTVSIGIAIALAFNTLIGIPIKAWHHHVTKPKCVAEPAVIWTPQLTRVYARGLMVMDYPQWSRADWVALDKLWTQESHWNHKSANKQSTAYGVAQVLNTKVGTPAPQQVARGLSYIKYRYGRPTVAWQHELRHGWY